LAVSNAGPNSPAASCASTRFSRSAAVVTGVATAGDAGLAAVTIRASLEGFEKLSITGVVEDDCPTGCAGARVVSVFPAVAPTCDECTD
jgi:hypothetical protein